MGDDATRHVLISSALPITSTYIYARHAFLFLLYIFPHFVMPHYPVYSLPTTMFKHSETFCMEMIHESA